MSLVPGSPAWSAHADQVRAAEAEEPEGWFWLSFVDERLPRGEQFLGVAIVRGRGPLTAIEQSHRMGCNPGGEVAVMEVPDEHVPLARYRNRILRGEELEAAASSRDRVELIEWPEPGVSGDRFGRFEGVGWWQVERTEHGVWPLAGPFPTREEAEQADG